LEVKNWNRIKYILDVMTESVQNKCNQTWFKLNEEFLSLWGTEVVILGNQ
jgi:hypothetical protein